MYKNPVIQRLCNPLHKSRQIIADVLRLDVVHPFVSGNKWFKLKFHMLEADRMHKVGMVSFGGAYSNHLVAMAHACREAGIECKAFVRGDQGMANDSIREMLSAGMDLIFVSREQYRNKEKLVEKFLEDNPGYYVVPEGGQGAAGVKGAEGIMDHVQDKYEYILCPVGTGTTLAGIINRSNGAHVIGISALKVRERHNNQLLDYISANTNGNPFELNFDYHFGGFARKTDELIGFMNRLYEIEKIPSDFVYTGKLFYAAEHLVATQFFEPGSRLLLVHTGGLQGNRSLKKGELVY